MASEPHTLQSRGTIRYRYRWHSAAFFAAMFALAMIALTATIVSSRAASTPLLDEDTMAASRAVAATRLPGQVSLASAGDLQLMLPIYELEVTAIGFHPVADENVIALVPAGRRINGSIIARSLGQVLPGNEGSGYVVMGGDDRLGPATASLDVGAPAGTVVFAPVDGTIAGIRAYNLKGKCPDVEVKIQPQSQSRLLVVMTHIDGLEASLGQPLKAGVTRLGTVRQLDGCLEQQLGQYTYDNGNHLHMQVELYR